MSNIYVVGYPKSGNTWLSRLIGDITNSPVDGGSSTALADEGENRPGKFTIVQRHSRLPLSDGQTIIITRDPRDIIVSVMYYWQMNNIDTVLTRERKPKTPLDPVMGIEKFLELWFEDYKKYVDVYTSYEALKEDTVKELVSILGKLGISANSNNIQRVVRRQSFNKRKKAIKLGGDNDLPYGKTIQLRNMRKGIVGDWKNHFNRSHGKIVHEHLWEWMYRLGYESNKSWWETLPE